MQPHVGAQMCTVPVVSVLFPFSEGDYMYVYNITQYTGITIGLSQDGPG